MISKPVSTPYKQTILIGTRWGQMIALTCDPFQTSSLGFYGEWAKAECEILCGFINPGDVVLDIGANVGSLTIPMARKTGPGGLVMAFEPQRAPFYCLCGNVALNHLLNSVRVFNAAVSDFDGVIEVPTVNIDEPFNIGGVRLEDAGYDLASPMPKEETPCLEIDSMNLPRVNLIKIDVETMESKVLAGASETIDRCKPIVMAEALLSSPQNEIEMRAFFTAHGYAWRIIETPLYSPDNIRFCQDCIFPGTDRNMVAIPDDKPKPDWFLKL